MVLLGAALTLQWRQFVLMNQTSLMALKTRTIQHEIVRLRAMVLAIETGTLGFVASKQDNYLTIYKESKDAVLNQMETVLSLLGDKPALLATAREIGELLKDRIALAERLINIRIKTNAQIDLQEIISKEASEGMSRIDSLFDKLEKDNQSAYDKQKDESSRLKRERVISSTIYTGISAAILLIMFVLMYRENVRRRKAEDIADRLAFAQEDVILQRTSSITALSQQLHMATEAADVGIWDWDVTSNSILWDKIMFKIYGMPMTKDGRIRYEDWKKHVHPDDVFAQEASLRKTKEEGGCNQRIFRIVRESDKKTRFIHASDVPILGADGKTIRVVGVNIDNTEATERINEIQKLNLILNTRAAELEASVKELDAFSYSVSHDLRAPLRAIDGFSRIVQDDYAPKLNEEGVRMLGVIRSEAQRMGRLIDDLLVFSRLGRQRIEDVEIDMEAMVKKIFEEQIAMEPSRVIRLNLLQLPSAFGTEAMIRQVWSNLISNAIKFTSKREVAEIEIGVKTGKAGENVYFIKDNGAGFDMRYADKLFGVFVRLHSTEEFPGNGVGLALVQRIVHRHGGKVWGEGEVGKGAIFFFTIPDPRKENKETQTSTATQNPERNKQP